MCWRNLFRSFSFNDFQVVVAYNPLGWNRTEIVRIPVSMYFVFWFLAKQVLDLNWLIKLAFPFLHIWHEMSENLYQVNDSNLAVQDSLGNSIEAQFISLDNVTLNIRNFYTNAYLGVSSKQVPKVWLIFQVSVPPLGWNTYFISRRATKGRCVYSFSSGFS